jgi:hypothetical protein
MNGSNMNDQQDYGGGMRPLPHVDSLRSAVDAVINNYRENGFPPLRLIQATGDKIGDDLLMTCERLILGATPETLDALDHVVAKYRGLLTLEDLVARHGDEWGFSHVAVNTAIFRVQEFDRRVGRQRYS